MFEQLVERNRSYRRFFEDEPLPPEFLRYLVGLARLTPSATNLQPLRYILVSSPEKRAEVFSCLSWAGFLRDWPGPIEGERPTGYIVILSDVTVNPDAEFDVGIAAQTILLGAVEKGYGGCIIGSIQRRRIREILNVPENHDIELVIALGKPKEKVKIEPLPANGDSRYWRDAEQVHHVPKRSLDQLIVAEM
ncbi:MAG: nitroreductase family protein [Firmicutes bacterium]|nr:nitroreductase family protein [Bacillota bacterium]